MRLGLAARYVARFTGKVVCLWTRLEHVRCGTAPPTTKKPVGSSSPISNLNANPNPSTADYTRTGCNQDGSPFIQSRRFAASLRGNICWVWNRTRTNSRPVQVRSHLAWGSPPSSLPGRVLLTKLCDCGCSWIAQLLAKTFV
jgi:hypothetical protein